MMLTMLYLITLSYLTHAQITKISQVGQIQVKQTLFNQTYALAFMQTSFAGYYHIEVNEQNQTNLVIMFKQSSPPIYNNSSIIADKIDSNGYALNRTYHHLVVQGSTTGYLTILTNQLNVQYTLSITKSVSIPCANGCSNNGVCLETGVCSCDMGFINEDCSTPAILVYANDQHNFALTQQFTYFYYQAETDLLALLYINCTGSSGIRVQIIVPNFIYLPSNSISNQDDRVDEEEQYRTKLNLLQNQTIVIKITINNYINIDYNYYYQCIIQISNGSSNSGLSVNMIILYVFVGLAALLFILILLVCIKRHKARQNIAQARIQKFEQIHPIVDFKLIPIVDGVEDIQQDECTICLGKFLIDELIRKTPCQPVPHIFHDLCIRQWLVKHAECPNCRFDISGKQLAVLKQQH